MLPEKKNICLHFSENKMDYEVFKVVIMDDVATERWHNIQARQKAE